MASRIPLSRERIAEAALELVDTVGVEKFTMRALGGHLGVDPMAIYHYLPNKEAVFDAVVEMLWQGMVCTDGAENTDDVLCLHQFFCGVRRHLLAHPRAVLLLGTRPATTPSLLRLIEDTLARTSGALPAQEAMTLIDCLTAFTVGKVLGEVSQAEQQDKVAAALQSLSPQSHPHLLQALQTGYDFAPEAQFARGLRALIEGWQTESIEVS